MAALLCKLPNLDIADGLAGYQDTFTVLSHLDKLESPSLRDAGIRTPLSTQSCRALAGA